MPPHIENLICITLVPLFLVLLGAACLIWAEILGSMLKPRGARPLPARMPGPDAVPPMPPPRPNWATKDTKFGEYLERRQSTQIPPKPAPVTGEKEPYPLLHPDYFRDHSRPKAPPNPHRDRKPDGPANQAI